MVGRSVVLKAMHWADWRGESWVVQMVAQTVERTVVQSAKHLVVLRAVVKGFG